MDAFAGIYWNREDDSFLKVFLKDAKLRMNDGGDEVHVLKPAGEARFHLGDVPWRDEVEIQFVAAASDQTRRLERSFSGGNPTVFEAVQESTPTNTALAEYVGDYVSQEIDPFTASFCRTEAWHLPV